MMMSPQEQHPEQGGQYSFVRRVLVLAGAHTPIHGLDSWLLVGHLVNISQKRGRKLHMVIIISYYGHLQCSSGIWVRLQYRSDPRTI